MSDNAFFPEMQALRKKKKGSVFSEPRSADNFSPVLEELEEDQEVIDYTKFLPIITHINYPMNKRKKRRK